MFLKVQHCVCHMEVAQSMEVIQHNKMFSMFCLEERYPEWQDTLPDYHIGGLPLWDTN